MGVATSDGTGSRNRSAFELYGQGQASPSMKLTIQLVLAGRRWRSLLDEKLRATGQSSARMEALAAIYAEPEPRPQVDIAKRLRIEGPTLTRMLDALEKDRLVARKPDPDDRRTKLLELTDEGKKVLERIFGEADELRTSLVGQIPAAEIDAMNGSLERLIDKLDNGLPQAE